MHIADFAGAIKVFVTVFLPVLVTKTSGTSCKADYANQCLTAATRGQLPHLKGNGECERNGYARYTHTCSVSNYYDDVTQCCCVDADNRVMCCRYHDAWNMFRCDDKDDVIGIALNVMGKKESKEEPAGSVSTSSVPLHIILPAVLVPAILVLVCVIFLINQCHFHKNSEDTCVTCWRKRRKHEKPGSQRRQVEEQDETNPLRTELHGDLYPPINNAIPSAPPIEDTERLPSYESSHVTDLQDSNNSKPHSGSPTCAPPTYAESFQHRVFHSQT